MSDEGKRALVAPWIGAVGLLVTVLFVAFNVAYRMGAAGVRVAGANVSFGVDRGERMFRVSDALALMTTDEGGATPTVRLVQYRAGMVPFAPVCGAVEPDGSRMNGPTHLEGTVLFDAAFDPFDRDVAVDLASGRSWPNPHAWDGTSSDAPDPTPAQRRAALAAAGVSVAAARPFSMASVEGRYPELAVIKESCTTFNAAFFLVYAFLGVAALLSFVLALASRRAAS